MNQVAAQPKITTVPEWLRRFSVRLRQREDRIFLILTLVIGAIVGAVVVAFIVVTERAGARMYPPGSAAWRRVLVPILGALGSGYLLYRYFPNARGSGVPQTKAALLARGGRITLRTVLGKFFCSSTSLASGIALGREGPAVQVGAGIASVLGRSVGLSGEKVQALVPVGAAAALAAAFNTPLAAVLFSLEEVMGDLNAPVLGSVVLSSATSWMVLRLMLGNEPLFHVPQYELVHPLEFSVYAILGVYGGFVSAAFVKSLLWLRERFQTMPGWSRAIQPVAGGLVVGLMTWRVPQVLGVGYSFVGQALNGKMALATMALLLVLKLIATPTCYASGNAGGIFGPSLFIGAMLGGVLGSVAHQMIPGHTAGAGAYALVGMGTAFAGIIRVPITSVIMIFEITHDYAIIVPLMISNVVSFFISSRLQAVPIYEALARQDGIHLPSAATRERRGRPRVGQVMRPPGGTLSAETTVDAALTEIRQSGLNAALVTDQRGLAGVISARRLEQAISEDHGAEALAEVVDTRSIVHLHPDHSLDLALERLGAAGVDLLPVVSRADARQLEGVVFLRDVLETYGIAPRPAVSANETGAGAKESDSPS